MYLNNFYDGISTFSKRLLPYPLSPSYSHSIECRLSHPAYLLFFLSSCHPHGIFLYCDRLSEFFSSSSFGAATAVTDVHLLILWNENSYSLVFQCLCYVCYVYVDIHIHFFISFLGFYFVFSSVFYEILVTSCWVWK